MDIDSIKKFRNIFDNSDIVKSWEAKGFDHVGTIFVGPEYTIGFPMDGGFVLEKVTYLREIKFDMDMLELIYNTKKYIIDLDKSIVSD